MKKSNLMPSLVLGSICLVVALLLSVVNMFTAPVIEAAQNAAANAALLEVLPEGKNFKQIEITDEYPDIITSGYKADGGFVFRMTVTGKNPGLVIMCGINSDGKVVGTKVIAEQETDSYDANVFPFVEGTDGKYKDMTLDSFEPHLVSGATLTSRAYGEAIKAALQSFVIANGGSVDTRTPEEILSDNLNAALNTTGKTFTKWFATEVITGIDQVYVCDDNSGYVFVIGESFIGVNASGNIVSVNVSSENSQTVNTAYTTITSSTLTAVDLPAGVSEDAVEAFVTASGNYVIVTKGDGYGITGDKYVKSGKQITIKTCISSEGAIICSTVVEEKETPDFGSDLLKGDGYTGKYTGKNADTYQGVENVAGVTATCKGYKAAIKCAFDTFELLIASKGGNE